MLSSYSVHLITLLYCHNFVSFSFLIYIPVEPLWIPIKKCFLFSDCRSTSLTPHSRKCITVTTFFPISLANNTCHQLLSHPVSAMVLNRLEMLIYENFSSIKDSCPLNLLVPSHRFKSEVFQRTLTQQSNSIRASRVERDSFWNLDWNYFGNFINVYVRNLSLTLPSLCKPGFCPS